MTMAGPFKIGVEDDTGADLGFVLSCLAFGIITMDELHQWIHHVIAQTPGGDVPPHLVALLALKKPASVFRPNEAVMHRIPHDPFITDERFDAMLGLQFFLRRDRTQAVDITQSEAEEALRRNPEVANRFFDLFPFLMEKVD
ncbi:hypothetical protein [Yoonia sediminilitoris]|uniref:Uncharacterized protein n=1 Tax=Yoonia sediminilitoris TaxID=1286148 RepID=A0A2T6KK69_9RHOB|nr:hypothetical protein [Yoonia sediminilitoris]PUB16367.1 hypothetical protein C8N45_103222 [Yoonia sediminilitoris]RCW96716.1 hypothetical protein DFP92_103222 [Yoonia sediminilitoris]